MAEQPHPINPLDSKPIVSEDSNFVKNIVSTESGEADENILEAPPEIDPILLEGIEPPKSIALLILKIFFGFLLVAGMISIAFFTSQLSNKFDFITSYFGIKTPASQMVAINNEIIAAKDESNFYNYLQLKAYLDQFSYFGDEYLQNYEIFISQTASEQEKIRAKSNMSKVRGDLKSSFNFARQLSIQPFAAQLINLSTLDNEYELNSIFEKNLRSKFEEKASALSENESVQAKREYKNYTQSSRLIGNRDLKSLMMETDFEALSDAGLYELIQKVNNLIVNDLSTIHAIKAKRVKWSDVMREIDRRTIAVDPQYNDKYYDELGGIRYTSYDFDANNRRISIVGETKLINTTTFTMISNLIDEFNRSRYFTNAEMRSFSKSGSLNQGYTSSLHLSVELKEKISADNEEEKIDPEKLPEFLREEDSIKR